MIEKLDAIDIKILKVLQQNAKLTTKELAEAVHLSPSPTFERQKRLEREGYIKKYVAIVDPEMAGNGMQVFCNIRLKQHGKGHAREFVDAVKQMEEVTECFNTSGDYDFMIKVFVRNMRHYQDFVLNRLGEMESVGSVHSVFVIGTVKCLHSVPVAQ
ncbi:MAG: Lrp/AsnC family transcriptional regulator [Sodaliphilus sp.]